MGANPVVFESATTSWEPTERPTRKQLWSLLAVYWGCEFLLATMRSFVDHTPQLALYTELRIFSALFGSVECYGLHCLAQATRKRSFHVQIGTVLVASALAGALNLYGGDFFQNLSTVKVIDYGAGWRIYNLTYWVLMFGAWAAIYLAIRYGAEAKDQERHARLLERFAHSAQLRALRFQVDPHFLFNTLNSVSALVRARRIAEAEAMIGRMSDFFRSTLAANPHDDISLADEVALQQVYLEIERTRFPDMSVEIDLPGELRSARVPALLLQPVVENAVKYSVASRTGPARIRIRAALGADGTLELSVTDDGTGLPSAAGTGTGLNNVNERLRARFGSQASVSAGPSAPTGWQVAIRMPLALA